MQKEKQYKPKPGVYIYLRGKAWMLRYRIPVEVNGVRKLQDKYVKLAPREEYNSAKSVEHLAKPYLESLPDKLTTATTQTVANFIEYVYFPHVEQEGTLAPSTIFGYRHIFKKHLRDRLGDTRLCDYRTATGQALLNRISSESKLSHTSLKHIKWFLVAALKYAKQVDAFQKENPMIDTSVPRGGASRETHAYTLEEIATMLRALAHEPIAGAVVAVAAFTGLRRSELRGLRWDDLRDNQLFISRSVWNTEERNKTKTADSAAPVPVLPMLADLLSNHRNGIRLDGYIFAGQKSGRPLNLANLARRVVVPSLKDSGVEWQGWHAFRRGLATNLYDLNVPEADIQAIMRHAHIETTRKHYIKKTRVQQQSKDAISTLGHAFKSLRRRAHVGSRLARRRLGTSVGTARKAIVTGSQ